MLLLFAPGQWLYKMHLKARFLRKSKTPICHNNDIPCLPFHLHESRRIFWTFCVGCHYLNASLLSVSGVPDTELACKFDAEVFNMGRYEQDGKGATLASAGASLPGGLSQAASRSSFADRAVLSEATQPSVGEGKVRQTLSSNECDCASKSNTLGEQQTELDLTPYERSYM